MSTTLCVTVRFLQPICHGRGDGAEPEWPPSPLRLFQALVAASAARWNEREKLTYAREALGWLEQMAAPAIVATPGVASEVKYRLYVPDNTADLAATSWARGDTAKIVRRTEKDVRPTHLQGETVAYLFPLQDESTFSMHREALTMATRSLTHLGWGIDMVAGDVTLLTQDQVSQLPGERWLPVADASAQGYRVPIAGTLQALMDRHAAFLHRLGPDGFRPVPPLSAFRVMGYRRATDPSPLPFVAFSILKPDASGYRPFDTVRRFAEVAGMVRHAAAEAARQAGWEEGSIISFILGHGGGEEGQATTNDRLMFLPLPSITPRKVESIRRVMVVGPEGGEIGRLRQLLAGWELRREGDAEPVGLLSLLPATETTVRRYVGPSRVWSTVTPVMLPGYDDPDGLRRKLRQRPTAAEQHRLLDRLDRRIRALLRTAFVQAGWHPSLADATALDYREAGFRPGADLSRRYALPPLRFPRYHVRVAFPHPVRGPLVLGAGRYRGLGLFATDD